jgi:hypothetical protein
VIKIFAVLSAMIKCCLLISVLLPVTVAAQRADYISFQNKTADVGIVSEDGSALMYTFDFVNTAEKTFSIIAVKPSCGCTTPNFSKNPISIGGKGFVSVRFDPKGRPGYFSKTLSVITDYNAEPIVLTIRGTVSASNEFSELREMSGNWRMKTNSFNMGRVWVKDDWLWKEFEVANVGEKQINLLDKKMPAFVRVEGPSSIQPGAKAIVRVGYNGLVKNAYGFQTDNVELITDDEEMPRKSFSVYATLEEYFGDLSEEERKRAPVLAISETTIDLGRFSSAATVKKTVTLVNTGKKPLYIRSIQPNCKCLTAVAATQALAAGKSTSLTIQFNPEQRKATQQKYVTVYSNDPSNPVQRIVLSAYVE